MGKHMGWFIRQRMSRMAWASCLEESNECLFGENGRAPLHRELAMTKTFTNYFPVVDHGPVRENGKVNAADPLVPLLGGKQRMPFRGNWTGPAAPRACND